MLLLGTKPVALSVLTISQLESLGLAVIVSPWLYVRSTTDVGDGALRT